MTFRSFVEPWSQQKTAYRYPISIFFIRGEKMIKYSSSYINKKYIPNSKDLVVAYKVTPNRGVDFNNAAAGLAAESSIGTWTKISTMNKRIASKLKPSVFYANKKTGTVKIAYNQDLFEQGNMSQILSSIAGNVYGLKEISKLRLLDITFPKDIVKSFPGPKFGIDGIRKITKVKKRPLIGTIVKPKLGLTAKQHAQVAYDAWIGGLDIVKDDENLSSMTFNKFKERIKLTLKARAKAEKETGEIKIYMPNITAETFEMIKRAEYVKSQGGRYLMIDVLTTGFAAVHTIRNQNPNLVIHAHRAMHGALTRQEDSGMTMLSLAKIFRLLGVDQLHIGTAGIGKMHGKKDEELAIEDEIEDDYIKETKYSLKQNWYNKKPVLAVASGGLHPGMIPAVMKAMGNDIVMQFGGGVHWHPKGTKYGAMAARQALEATLKGIKLEKAEGKELSEAVKKFGVRYK